MIKKQGNEVYNKESNNPDKVKTTATPAVLILQSDTEQIYFIGMIYVSIHVHICT